MTEPNSCCVFFFKWSIESRDLDPPHPQRKTTPHSDMVLLGREVIRIESKLKPLFFLRCYAGNLFTPILAGALYYKLALSGTCIYNFCLLSSLINTAR